MSSATGVGRGRPRVLVIGAGFGGFHCLRTLERILPAGAAELVAVNPSDYMLYVPLLPEVAAGSLDPRQVAVPLRSALPRTKLMLGSATDIDVERQVCTIVDVEGRARSEHWDYLVLASGSVTRLLSIPGVAEHAKGFKSIAESIYLRDHILRQLQLAEQTDDPAERAARTTFVVVGAGYTGTEVAAQGQLLAQQALRRHPGLHDNEVRWMLLDLAPRVLPGLNPRLSKPTARVLRRRGVDVRMETSVSEVGEDYAKLTDGTEIPTRTVVWCVGVRPDPVVESLGLDTERGRVVVDDHLRVPRADGLYAIGDVAAVPDPAQPGESTPMTAQHAQRHGETAGRNVAAALGFGEPQPYRYRAKGFVVDLGGWHGVADPFHVPVSGPLAKVIARGYHLAALPAGKLRVAFDWLADALTSRQLVQFGLVSETGVSLREADRVPTHGETAPAEPHAASR